MFDTFVSLSGLIASIWIIFGVYIAGKFYPNYSHTKQFCSELGAIGSPTKNLSPLINNYPLGLLFCLFGWYVCNTAESLPLLLAGFMVIIHGVGTLVAGYFAMDNDLLTKNPSFECKVHSWAGMFVLLSLLIAPVLIVFTPENKSFSLSFKLASICCVVISIALLVRMVKEFKSNGKPGLYQRLAYGAQLVWLSALSIILA